MFSETPWMLDLAIALGQEYAERGIIAGDSLPGMTPDMAKEQWTAIQADPKHAYWDQYNPGHQAAVQKVAALFQAMHAGRGEGRLVL